MRIDLHVHSKLSRHPGEWVLRKLGTRESYTEPTDVYRIAKARGMDAVTLTDHNTIDGCLAIAHLEDTFISCEYTTYFPSDGCKVHVLCYHITPEQHQCIQEIRSNILELVKYLKGQNILHSLAHALFSPNSRLTADHFDSLLKLFDMWEINGARDSWSNQYLQLILGEVKPDHKLTAGSDDHSSLTIGNMWTEVPNANSVSEFLKGLRAGRACVGGTASTPHTLAWNIYSVGWQWLKDIELVNGSSAIIDHHLLPPERWENHSLARKIWLSRKSMNPGNWGRAMAFSLINREFQGADMRDLGGLPPAERWFHITDRITSKYIARLGNRILNEIAEKRMYNVFSNIGLPLGLYFLLTPFLVAFGNFSSQRKLAQELLFRYKPSKVNPIKVAKFTDTFGTVDGVSKTLDEQLREALRTGRDYTIIACVGENNRRGLKLFTPVGMIETPEFEQQKLCWPPLLQMLDYCYKEQFTHIQAATPGPVGLAGLVVAKTLGIPFQAVYHTQVPEFVAKTTDDPFLEEIAWKYCLWFYDNAETIFAPSEHVRRHLIDHGIRPEKAKMYPRGIDTNLYNPAKRSDYWEKRWGIPPGTVKALYVGRVSWEKNLPLLVRAFKKLTDGLKKARTSGEDSAVTLIVVGDGGYSEEMRRECGGYPAVFTGELHGDELAEAFASADFFVFPSTTDTYGRVVMEAVASGIPSIVSNVGGPKEHIIEGVTGLVIPADNEKALADAMAAMSFTLDRQRMGRQARDWSEPRSFSEAFNRYWGLYAA